MPYSAPRPCTYPGCGKAQTNGSRCDDHPYEKKRSAKTNSYKWLYNTSRWIKGRVQFLNNNPLCEVCKQMNITEAAMVVDHKIPHNGDTKLFFDRKNWRGLCKRHHDRKTASSDGGFGNPRGESGE